MWKIKKETIESICLAARNNYPNEFMSFLGGDRKKELVSELVVLPAIFGRDSATVDIMALPIDRSVIGTVHSHPGTNNYPSSADKKLFSERGWIHLIIAQPYAPENIRAFDGKGKEIDWNEE